MGVLCVAASAVVAIFLQGCGGGVSCAMKDGGKLTVSCDGDDKVEFEASQGSKSIDGELSLPCDSEKLSKIKDFNENQCTLMAVGLMFKYCANNPHKCKQPSALMAHFGNVEGQDLSKSLWVFDKTLPVGHSSTTETFAIAAVAGAAGGMIMAAVLLSRRSRVHE